MSFVRKAFRAYRVYQAIVGSIVVGGLLGMFGTGLLPPRWQVSVLFVPCQGNIEFVTQAPTQSGGLPFNTAYCVTGGARDDVTLQLIGYSMATYTGAALAVTAGAAWWRHWLRRRRSEADARGPETVPELLAHMHPGLAPLDDPDFLKAVQEGMKEKMEEHQQKRKA